MRKVLTAGAALMALAIATPSFAQDQAPATQTPVLAKVLAPARGGSSRLLVTSTAFTSGEQLSDMYTQNGENMSPPIRWSKGPQGTVAYAVIAEDSGVNRAEPIVHWIIYDIPVTTTTLPAGIPTQASLENGAAQGKNIRGQAGYVGPKPPAGQTHPYHFQVFALNGKLRLDPANADRKAVLDAMKGKVLASGDLTVNYTGK
jgi:Raf kinase inhibitor-like YbhB/YbcL family protein